MAARDNRIAAESVGINVTKYKLMAFVTSAALAGAAGTLYGCSQTTFAATKFDFNTSILILVFVVLVIPGAFSLSSLSFGGYLILILFTLLIPSVIWLLNKALEVLGLLARKAEGGKHAS